LKAVDYSSTSSCVYCNKRSLEIYSQNLNKAV
jgi:hypothetical protein